ncbi:MAG: SOS response-associated peptidase family protein, partial [Acidimicrobiia bacterium]
ADDNWVRSCAILTTAATGIISDIHHRMPVALAVEVWQPWLDREIVDPEQVRDLIRAIDPDLWMEREVSSRVNSIKNNGPELLHPPAQARLL